MKKIFTAVLVGTALSVSACGGSGNDNNSSNTITQERPEQRSFVPDEDEFLQDVAEYMTPDLYNEPQQDVLALGYVICDKFAEGFDIDDIIAGGGGHLSNEDVIVIAASAQVNLCPGVSPDGSSST